MSDRYKGIYRGQTFRLRNWDYGSNGIYFITICTQNRTHFFGEIKEGTMNLSELGMLAKTYWQEIPIQFPFIQLNEFVIMPNHIHGILIIDNFPNDSHKQFMDNHIINGGFAGKKNPMIHKNISRVIRWYKGRCSFEMRKIQSDFTWQKLFHDHIIRNQEAFLNIKRYIIDNLKKWDEDKTE